MKTENKEVFAANESKFHVANYSEALTTFASSWQDNDGLGDLLEYIAPAVKVGRRFEYKSLDGEQMFYSEKDDLRAIGSDFKRIDFAGRTIQDKTYNKGLSVRIDHDEVVGDNWQERYVHLLMNRLYRNELRRAIKMLDSCAVKKEKTWNEDSNPDGDIRNELLLTANEIGVFPNRLLFGDLAWFSRIDTYSAQENAGARMAAEISKKSLAEKLLIEDIKMIQRRHLGLQGTEMSGKEIYSFYTKPGLIKDEPANIKRFVSPIDGESSFRVYVEEGSKFTDITVEHYSNIVITSNKGIGKLVVK